MNNLHIILELIKFKCDGLVCKQIICPVSFYGVLLAFPVVGSAVVGRERDSDSAISANWGSSGESARAFDLSNWPVRTFCTPKCCFKTL